MYFFSKLFVVWYKSAEERVFWEITEFCEEGWGGTSCERAVKRERQLVRPHLMWHSHSLIADLGSPRLIVDADATSLTRVSDTNLPTPGAQKILYVWLSVTVTKFYSGIILFFDNHESLVN